MNEEILMVVGTVSEKTKGGSNEYCQETTNGSFRYSYTWPYSCL